MPVTSPTSESGRAGLPGDGHRPGQPPGRGLGPGRSHASVLVEDALTMAFANRAPEKGVIFHSDRGCQGEFNRSIHEPDFAELARANGVVLSVGRKGECWDCEKNGDVVGSGLTLATTGRSCLCVDLSTRPAGVHPELLAGREGSDE